MVSTKKLVSFAVKWQKLIAIRRRGVAWTRTVASKGHFVAYTIDGRRFVIPLAYLKSDVFRELFRMAEEEFGVPSDGPITLPCSSMFMEYAMSIMRKYMSIEMQDLLLSLVDF